MSLFSTTAEPVLPVVSPAPGVPAGVVPAVLVVTVLLLGGCATQRSLMPTPTLYAAGIEEPWAATLPEDLRTARVEVLYATDRVPEPRPDGRLDYGIGRSRALAVGEATVDIGGGASWEQLVADARTGIRNPTLYLDVPLVTEVARTPDYPVPYTVVDGMPVVDERVKQEFGRVAEAVEQRLNMRLAQSPRKEILLYVHGVANTFDDALFTTAELWHYLGREFVPVAYTWPAGQGGVRGYTYDRESSEFTVFHFKRFLDWLSRLPEVEGIHVIAHSRGTDVVTTGIRELLIEVLARGEVPRERLKLRNVVLAAPDINLEVATMRTATEFFSVGVERVTMYTSPHDKAIGLAELLFGGGLRLGQFIFRTAEDDIKERGARVQDDQQAIIEYVGEQGGTFGHNYFRTNPAVSSDLVLTVRYGRKPGAENGRPLEHQTGIFWTIHDDYPLAKPPQ